MYDERPHPDRADEVVVAAVPGAERRTAIPSIDVRRRGSSRARTWGCLAIVAIVVAGLPAVAAAPSGAGHEGTAAAGFPPTLESYGDAGMTGLWEILRNRVEREPFDLLATVLFLGAIVHTFLTHRFLHIAHVLERRREERVRAGTSERETSSASRLFHFLGEIEAVFGIWVVPLILALTVTHGWSTAVGYIEDRVNFTEAVFVVVIMAIASTRPILELAEKLLGFVARLGGGTPIAWWLVLLTVGPVLGSFVTEPAAMTICASLLSRRFYALAPSKALSYGTLGMLFVAISVGGTLTHFAAPPVLMVAGPWGWDTPHMLTHFGWKAIVGVVLAVSGYALFFRRELLSLAARAGAAAVEPARGPAIPRWVTLVHLLFLAFTVANSHHPTYLALGLLFFLAVVEVTEEFQRDFSLRPPVLVGFFLAGLVIHGGLQQWWIAPVLGRLGEVELALGATALTAFNDNAAITYLCTLVPSFTDGMKYAAVAGAVAGGGLTVIANAPNPAGQSILGKHFEDGISPAGLLVGSLVPTAIVLACFLLLG